MVHSILRGGGGGVSGCALTGHHLEAAAPVGPKIFACCGSEPPNLDLGKKVHKSRPKRAHIALEVDCYQSLEPFGVTCLPIEFDAMENAEPMGQDLIVPSLKGPVLA